MSVVDVNRILTGTDQKAFDQAYNKLLSDYNEETASEFFKVYKDKPLSFILKNLENIVKEAYYGTDFIHEIVKRGLIPFYKVDEVCVIIERILNQFNNKANIDQLNGYNSLRESIIEFREKFKNTIHLSKLACENGGFEYLDTYYNYLFEILNGGSDEELRSLAWDLNELKTNPYVSITLSIPLLMNSDESAHTIYSIIHDFCVAKGSLNYSTLDDKNRLDSDRLYYETMKAIQIASNDEAVLQLINSSTQNLKFLWRGISESEIPLPKKPVTESSNIPIFSTFDLFDRMVEESGETDSLLNDEVKCKRYDYLQKLRSYYAYEASYNLMESSLTGDDSYMEKSQEFDDKMCDIEAEIATMEWTDNGEPDPIVKSHIMTKKQIEREKNSKESESSEKKSEDKDDDIDSETSSKKEFSSDNKEDREFVLSLCAKGADDIPDASIKIVEKDKEKFLSGESNSVCLGSFKKLDLINIKKAIKDSIDDYSEDFTIIEDNYNTLFLKVRKGSDYFMEVNESVNFSEATDDGEGESSVAKVDKPKEDFSTKVQNKAMDHEAKRQEKKGERDLKKTKLKNAGKAIMAGPKDWFKSASSFNEKITKMDDSRRKEFFLKPGVRHKIFRNLKHALLYGAAARANIFYLPVAMVVRHFSKDKDRRIRNELIRELDAEIRICDEKINDSNSNGDQQEKYKLMRIKDKLLAEKNRVQLNSKYI